MHLIFHLASSWKYFQFQYVLLLKQCFPFLANTHNAVWLAFPSIHSLLLLSNRVILFCSLPKIPAFHLYTHIPFCPLLLFSWFFLGKLLIVFTFWTVLGGDDEIRQMKAGNDWYHYQSSRIFWIVEFFSFIRIFARIIS